MKINSHIVIKEFISFDSLWGEIPRDLYKNERREQ